MKLYELSDGEQWWYVAESEDAALRMYLEPIVCLTGESLPEDLSDIEEKLEFYTGCTLDDISITEIAPEETLKVKVENETGEEVVEKTATEWCEGDVGLVASSVY